MKPLATVALSPHGASSGSVAAILIAAVIGASLLILFLAALISVLRSPQLTGTEKLLWSLTILILQLFGPLA